MNSAAAAKQYIQLNEIKPRIGQALMPSRIDALLSLAKQIGRQGLLQAIRLDNCNRIICGDTRVQAITLLGMPREERVEWLRGLISSGAITGTLSPELEMMAKELAYKRVKVAYTQADYDSSEEAVRAFSDELAENAFRKKKPTGKELERIRDRLKAAGYVSKRGRPKNGKKPLSLNGFMCRYLGIHRETLRRRLIPKTAPAVENPAEKVRVKKPAAKMSREELVMKVRELLGAIQGDKGLRKVHELLSKALYEVAHTDIELDTE